MRYKSKTAKKYFSLFILVAVLFADYLDGLSGRNRIANNLAISTGYVYSTSIQHRGWVNLKYQFQVNEQSIAETKVMGVPSIHNKVFLDRSFPVVYSKKNSRLNELLVLPKDFKKYNISYPDSLVWVMKYLQ